MTDANRNHFSDRDKENNYLSAFISINIILSFHSHYHNLRLIMVVIITPIEHYETITKVQEVYS